MECAISCVLLIRACKSERMSKRPNRNSFNTEGIGLKPIPIEEGGGDESTHGYMNCLQTSGCIKFHEFLLQIVMYWCMRKSVLFLKHILPLFLSRTRQHSPQICIPTISAHASSSKSIIWVRPIHLII